MIYEDVLIQWSPKRREYDEFVQRYARHFGLRVQRFDLGDNAFKALTVVKHARMVLIWNGLQGGSCIIARACRRRAIPHAFFEWGLAPQGSTFSMDLTGFCGDSFLNGPLGWVTNADLRAMRERRDALQRQYPLEDEGFVLVPLQIHNDTQIIYNSPYQNMDQMLAHVRRSFPGMRIVVRPHPKSANKRVPDGFETGSGGSFYDWARRASAVVGITSTCLWESALLGKPVFALGDHPLRTHALDPDRALAGALAMRVRRDGDPLPILERHNVRPTGRDPIPIPEVDRVRAGNAALEAAPEPPPVPVEEPETVEA